MGGAFSSPISIRKLVASVTFFFAPLEGITGWVYRSLHRQYFSGVSAYYAPFFAPTEHCPLAGRGLRDLLPENNRGVPLIPQLLVNEAEAFLPSARILQDMGFSEVNLNLGCPSGTVVAKKKGAGLLSQREMLTALLDGIFSADLSLRISVKTRVGMQDETQWPELLALFSQYPISTLIIHPRVRQDFYRTPVRMEAFHYAMAHTTLPLCYNGDLTSAQDCRELLSACPGLTQLMVGRGLVANPALGRELAGGPPLALDELKAFHDALVEAYARTLSGGHTVIGKMKELWFYMAHLFDHPEKPLKAIRKARTLPEYTAAAETLFRHCPLMPDGKFTGIP